MRSRLALLLAAVVSACARGPVGGPAPAGDFQVRVGLVVDRDSAAISATGQFRVWRGGDILAVQDGGAVWVATAAGSGMRLRRPDRDQPLELDGPVVLRPEREGDLVVVNGRRYRGELVVQRGSVGVTVINRVGLEWYLYSVVAAELGFRGAADREAVKAQAVAARTYAVRSRGRREALGFDVFPTDADQVYSGVVNEMAEVTQAVDATRGEILTWHGRPIEALFHSTCGWSTEAGREIFQNGDSAPYLRAVSDRTGQGARDFYCAISPRFRWREEWSAEELAALIGRAQPAVVSGAIGRITDVSIGATTPTGRVRELVISTTSGRIVLSRGRLREVLRPAQQPLLWSSLFQLHVTRHGEAVSRVVLAGAGYGHGVGMCQFGAVGRSRAGKSYREILAAYYHDTQLTRVN